MEEYLTFMSDTLLGCLGWAFDLFKRFDQFIPLTAFAGSAFVVYTVYRLFVSRIIGEGGFALSDRASDIVSSHVASDRAAARSREYDNRVHSLWSNHSYSDRKQNRYIWDGNRKVLIRK